MKQIRIPFLVIALSLMITGVAFAVDIPNISTWTQLMGVGGGGPGLGDVLLAPFYDVRTLADPGLPGHFGTDTHPQYTDFSIVNTDADYGVIVRLRFREWKRSREVLDLDIPLTTNDVWVGEVYRLPGGGGALRTNAGGGERWVSGTPSPLPTGCFPTSLFETYDFSPVGGGIGFVPFQTNAIEDHLVSRTEYGYIEFIGEERVGAPNSAGCFPRVSDRDVRDVLMGDVLLIKPDIQMSHKYNMTALSDFAVDPDGIWERPTTPRPNLLDSVQGGLNTATLLTNPGIGGFDQLEAILSKRFVRFQYATGVAPGDTTQTPMGTSLVITFVTKWTHYWTATDSVLGTTAFHIRNDYPFGKPFSGTWETQQDSSPYGEVFNYKIFDRKENSFTSKEGPPISPSTPETPDIPRLPWEVNVIGLYTDPTLLAPRYRNNLLLFTTGGDPAVTFNTGYAWIDLAPDAFTNDTRTYVQGKSPVTFNWIGTLFPTGAAPQLGWHWPAGAPYPGAYRGIPAIGIVMEELFDDSIPGYFGDSVPWQYNVGFGEVPASIGP